ncbi:Filamin-B-like [Oopsacas minuta]|uniref:Filamin-B-like n=1 Tax=Oopsacas minuta TaxID=111878 RepID=A0AAV7K1C8_9METZ|nr:Filamin-B-like [Oopsacas minuta]
MQRDSTSTQSSSSSVSFHEDQQIEQQIETLRRWCCHILLPINLTIHKLEEVLTFSPSKELYILVILQILDPGSYPPKAGPSTKRRNTLVRDFHRKEAIKSLLPKLMNGVHPLNYIDTDKLQEGDTNTLIQLIWHIIQRYQICSDCYKKPKGDFAVKFLIQKIQLIESRAKSDTIIKLWSNNSLLINLIKHKLNKLQIREEFESSEDEFDYLITLAKDKLNIPCIIPASQFLSSKLDFISIMIYLSFFFCSHSYLALFAPSIPDGDFGLESAVLTFLQEHSQNDSNIENSFPIFDEAEFISSKIQIFPSRHPKQETMSHMTMLQQGPGEQTVHIHKTGSVKEARRISRVDGMSHPIYTYSLPSNSKFHMVIALNEFGNTIIDVKVVSDRGVDIPFQLMKFDLRYELEFYHAIDPGDFYLVHILLKGMSICGSPFTYSNRFFESCQEVSKDYRADRKCYLVSSQFPKARMVTIQPNNVKDSQFPHIFPLGQPIQLLLDQLSTKNAMEKLQTVAFGETVGEVTLDISQQPNGVCLVTFNPRLPDTYDLHVKWDGKPLPNSPFRFTIMKFSQPEKCRIIGLDPCLSWVRVNEPLIFQVDANQAGIGELTVKANQPLEPVQSDLSIVRENGNLFVVRYRPRIVGGHKLHLLWNQLPIPFSPISFTVHSHDNPTPSALQVINIHEAPFILNRDETLELNMKGDFSLVPKLSGYGIKTDNTRDKIHLIYEKTDEKLFKVIFEPSDPGEYNVFIILDGQDIDGSPFRVDYGMGDAAACYVRGLNDRHYFVEQPIEFTLDASDAGRGKGLIKVGSHKTDSEPPGLLNIKDNDNGTYTVHYTPKKSKLHMLDITWNSDPVLGSPWEFCIEEPFVLNSDSNINIVETNRQMQLMLPTELCNFANIKDTDIIVDCVGEITGKAFAVVSKNEKGERVINFIPKFADIYTLTVHIDGVEQICSPWKVEAIDINETLSNIIADIDSKVEVNRPAIVNIKLTDTIHSPRLQIEVTGPSGSCEVEMNTDENNPFHVFGQFFPRVSGKYSISVLAYNKHIPRSPYTIKAVITEAARAAGECFIVEKDNNTFNNTLLIGQTCKFTVSTRRAGKGDLNIVIQGPGHAECRNVNNYDGTHCIFLTVGICGQYKVSVSWGSYAIVGSPLVIRFCGEIEHPELVGISLENKVLGVGVPYRFNLSVPRILGELDVFSIPLISALVSVEHQDSEHYEVSVAPKQIGDYLLGVKVGDYHVVGSPFPITYVSFCDANRCSLIVPSKNKCISFGEKLIYQVSTKNAGVGILEAVLINDEAKEMIPVIVRKLDENVFNIEIIPGGKDQYYLHILYGNNPIPGSPFSVKLSDFKQDIQCVVDGDFVQRCVVGRQCSFQVISSLSLSNSLQVRIQDSSGKETPSNVFPLRNRAYETKFTLTTQGSYNVSVKHNEADVIGSPFTITAVNSSAISPIKIGQFPKEIELGQQLEFIIDCSGANDSGDLVVKAIGPTLTKIFEDITIVEKQNNELRASFTPKLGGTYTLFSTWDGIEVLNSPFSVEVLISSDPKKVYVSGNGLSNGKVGELLEIIVDSRQAGPGELLVRITGPRENLNLELVPDSMNDKLDHVVYTPQLKGNYKVEIFWTKQAISESPFNIFIS